MIEFDELVKTYPDGTVAVDRLTLTIPAGAITVLVGPSGCGKTTSLRFINRMIEPTSGQVRIDGEDIASTDAAALRRKIGYVIQHAGLFPHRTVLDNVATVPCLNGMSKKEARSRAYLLLEQVGLNASIGKRFPVQLSGGQQQRVGVARALAADPPIMLMDEPFSAVDPVVRETLQNEFLRLQGDLGKTIVIVTHDVDEAIKLGDYVVVLAEGGKVAQAAPPELLLAAPASKFVADFVGRDRGYRSLSFVDATRLQVVPPNTEVSGMRLVVDAAGRPGGWAASNGRVFPVGGTWTRDMSLRAVLDLALVSPAGAAPMVDSEGKATGLALQSELIRAIQTVQQERIAEAVTP